MLVPAILYREEIIHNLQRYYYTDDMMYETGSMDNWTPNIADCPNEGLFQYAIVHNDKLIGFLSYAIDWYSSKAHSFGLFSFDRGNPIIGKDVFTKLEELVNQFHRIEWRMVGGNPAERGYDKFIKRHNGNKYVLKDSFKDRNGNYRDSIIYEILNTSI